jgi:hypothetical protein
MDDGMVPMRRASPGLPLAFGCFGALVALGALLAIILIASDERPPAWLGVVFWGALLVAVASFAWALGSLIGWLRSRGR